LSKNHVPDVPHHPIRRDIPEPSIVNESISHSRGTRPSIDSRRRTLMDHVDVKLMVARNLEKDHLAVVRKRPVQR
jgi:hypothetical protein